MVNGETALFFFFLLKFGKTHKKEENNAFKTVLRKENYGFIYYWVIYTHKKRALLRSPNLIISLKKAKFGEKKRNK